MEKLQELEEMAAKLLATARKLLPGQDRHSALREIGRFRARIAALKRPRIAAGASRVEGEGEMTRGLGLTPGENEHAHDCGIPRCGLARLRLGR